MPDPKSPVCRLLQAQLESHMSEFNQLELKGLEDSDQLREYLERKSREARLVYLQARKAGMAMLQAEELALKELYPSPETSEDEDEDPEA